MEWITGEKILEREGWGIVATLIKAYTFGLSPYRDFDGARMAYYTSKCFNCTKASPDYKPGRPIEQSDKCHPAQYPDLPYIDVLPSPVPVGLTIPPSPLELARKIDPTLVDYFFDEGEFVFQSGRFTNYAHPSAARLLVGVLGSSHADRLLMEETCSDFERMGTLDMGDRLKSAKFKLKEVERYERQRVIRQGEEGQVEEWPDNPLDLGKALEAKGYDPAECIRIMEQRHPDLNTAEVGAYARGMEPDDDNKVSCQRWYHRNKPR